VPIDIAAKKAGLGRMGGGGFSLTKRKIVANLQCRCAFFTAAASKSHIVVGQAFQPGLSLPSFMWGSMCGSLERLTYEFK